MSHKYRVDILMAKVFGCVPSNWAVFSMAINSQFEHVYINVPRAGFEPATYPLGGDCAIQLCHRGGYCIGADEDRTADLRIANATHSPS